MASGKSDPVPATDPEGGEGLFDGLKRKFSQVLYVQPDVSEVPASGSTAASTGAASAPRAIAVAHVGASVDPEMVRQLHARLWDTVDDAGPAFQQFLNTIKSLESVIPDPGQRIKAAISVLNGQGTTPVAIKLDLGKVRTELSRVMTEAEQGYSGAMQKLGKERGQIESKFRAEQEQLNVRLTELNREMSEIQTRLGIIPQEQQAAVVDVSASMAEITRNHENVKAASAAVVSELEALASHLG